MTMDSIEDAVVSAARAKGYQLNSATMMMVACDLAGSTLDGDSLVLPGKFSLKIADYVRDLHERAPSGFSKVQQLDKPADERTISELRRKRSLDPAWHDLRAKATGLTRDMMNEIAATRCEENGN
ncbi:hypothetical protein AB7M16_002039 [Bradyrhizobium sp. USDA 372]